MGTEKITGCDRLAKWFLVVINIIFVILGLVVFIIGMVLRFSPNTFLQNYIQPLLSSGGSQTNNQIQTQIDSIDLSSITNVIGIVLIVIGMVMLLVGFMGMTGACCQARVLLIVYAIIVIVLFLIQFGVFIAYFTQKETIVKDWMRTAIEKEYRGEEATDTYSAALNFLFIEGKCCGVDNYKDMEAATNWRRQYFYQGRQYTLTHPVTCCKGIQGTFPDYRPPADLNCAVTPTPATSNFEQGCFQFIDDLITKNITTAVIAIFIVFAIVQILAIVFAILLAVAIGRDGW